MVGQPGVFANMISPINVTKEKLDPADQVLQAERSNPAERAVLHRRPAGAVPDANAPAPCG